MSTVTGSSAVKDYMLAYMGAGRSRRTKLVFLIVVACPNRSASNDPEALG